ncbi:MAG: TAXI family TRAP transporter solute-binding subunit [Deltaproteobacteria bacterium]|nr:TAXI family TRAP transporter solute-binding subunit [Deltaproteobacteria bacterium]
MKLMRYLKLTLVVLTVVSVTGFAVASDKITETYLKMGTSSSGGIFNALGVATCQMWTERIPGVKFSAMVTGGSGTNSRMIGTKEIDVAFIAGETAFYAAKGEGQFKGKQVKNLMIIGNLFPAVLHFPVLKSSNIKTPYDFKDKKINVGTPGSGSETAAGILAYFDLKADVNFSARHMKHASAAEALTDEKIDGFIHLGGLGISHHMQAGASGKAVFIPFAPESVREKFTKENPIYYKFTMPANVYPNQNYPVETVATATFLAVRQDLSEELVYQMTKQLFDNLPTLIQAHSAAKEITLENILKGAVLPVHPGALKYYKEVGILK